MRDEADLISASEVTGSVSSYRVDGTFDLDALTRAAVQYPRHHFSLSELESELRAHPELVDDWLAWSAGESAELPWRFSDAGDGTFVVESFDDDGLLLREALYRDKFVACSAFIIHAIESSRRTPGG